MKLETHVVELRDLYSLIPSCRSLEQQNFPNLKNLLETLISAIESDPVWEFVQYINNKPSLFVVRKREESDQTSYAQRNSMYDSKPKRNKKRNPEPVVEEDTSNFNDGDTYEEEVENYAENIASTPSIAKLPWDV